MSSLTMYRPQDAATPLVDLGVPPAAARAIAAAYPSGAGLSEAPPAAIVAACRSAGVRVRGVPAWARRIRAAFALAAVPRTARDSDKPGVSRPSDVAGIVCGLVGDAERECFGAVLLDARQRVIAAVIVHVGTLASVEAHPREVFASAVRASAHSIVLYHNHPSGSVEPSAADIELTARMVSVGRVLGIPVVDHLVVSGDRWSSLASRGHVD